MTSSCTLWHVFGLVVPVNLFVFMIIIWVDCSMLVDGVVKPLCVIIFSQLCLRWLWLVCPQKRAPLSKSYTMFCRCSRRLRRCRAVSGLVRTCIFAVLLSVLPVVAKNFADVALIFDAEVGHRFVPVLPGHPLVAYGFVPVLPEHLPVAYGFVPVLPEHPPVVLADAMSGAALAALKDLGKQTLWTTEKAGMTIAQACDGDDEFLERATKLRSKTGLALANYAKAVRALRAVGTAPGDPVAAAAVPPLGAGVGLLDDQPRAPRGPAPGRAARVALSAAEPLPLRPGKKFKHWPIPKQLRNVLEVISLLFEKIFGSHAVSAALAAVLLFAYCPEIVGLTLGLFGRCLLAAVHATILQTCKLLQFQFGNVMSGIEILFESLFAALDSHFGLALSMFMNMMLEMVGLGPLVYTNSVLVDTTSWASRPRQISSASPTWASLTASPSMQATSASSSRALTSRRSRTLDDDATPMQFVSHPATPIGATLLNLYPFVTVTFLMFKHVHGAAG